MSFTAVINLDGEESNVLQCGFRFTETTDGTGRPTSVPRGGFITLTVESKENTEFFDWMISPVQTKSSIITFLKNDAISKLKTLEFTDAYCVDYYETFDHTGENPMQIQLVISATAIKLNESEYGNKGEKIAGPEKDNWQPVNTKLVRTTVGPVKEKIYENSESANIQMIAHEPYKPIERTPEEFENLARDPAQGNAIIEKSIHERTVGLALEAQGKLKPKIKRDPSGAAEFIDGNGIKWDVKSFNSKFPPKKGGFTVEKGTRKIEEELRKGENVILDTTNLSPGHVEQLRGAVEAKAWGDKIVWFP